MIWAVDVTVSTHDHLKRGILAAAVLLAAVADCTPAPQDQVRVVKITDGDTVHVLTPAGENVTVRLLGVDTPETVKPNSPVECYGPEATQYAKDHLLGQTVTLESDASQASTDWRGRTLGYLVFADGTDYSVEAARAGVATSYVYAHKPVRKYGAIEAAEQEARSAGRGLWGACPAEEQQ